MKKVWIAAGILVSSAATLLLYALDIPHWETLDLTKITASRAASVMYDLNGSEAMLLAGAETFIPTPADAIPDIVLRAFIAAEDSRFYTHHGLDLHRILGALFRDIQTLSLREGASTITQQLIKLTHLDGRKTLARKANEAWLALQLERTLSKEEILAAYLNAAYFGQGAYGIESAARVYFGKSAAALTLSEAATLAGIVQSPSASDPFSHPEKCATRRDYVLSRMLEEGFISKTELQQASAEPLPVRTRQETSAANLWYRDEVISEACRALDISADALLTGGYHIYTALDPQAQQTAWSLFNDPSRFPAAASDGVKPQVAFCAMEPASGEIRALIGGREYVTARGLDRATQSRRQPGSTLKPVSVYAAAIDALGLSPSSVLDDSPRAFAGGYTPVNAAGHYYGLTTLRTALARSLNVASVSLIEFTGIPLARQYAESFGIHLDDSDNGLSLALGGLTYGVTPAELTGAYAALANGGKAVTPHVIRRITDRNGRTIYEFTPPARTVLSPESAYMITSMLETAVSEGSARALQAAGVPIAAKTGTAAYSGEANRDIWTAAYTPDWVACAWMGFDETDASHVLPASESGSGHPARLLGEFFAQVASGEDFAVPPGIARVNVDKNALSTQNRALLAPAGTPAALVTTEIFRKGGEPKNVSAALEAPAKIQDLRGIVTDGGKVCLSFTALSDGTDYLIFRRDENERRVLAVISGERGALLEFTDEMDGPSASYSVMGRNRLLFENGVTKLGEGSEEVTLYRRESLFTRLESLLGL